MLPPEPTKDAAIRYFLIGTVCLAIVTFTKIAVDAGYGSSLTILVARLGLATIGRHLCFDDTGRCATVGANHCRLSVCHMSCFFSTLFPFSLDYAYHIYYTTFCIPSLCPYPQLPVLVLPESERKHTSQAVATLQRAINALVSLAVCPVGSKYRVPSFRSLYVVDQPIGPAVSIEVTLINNSISYTQCSPCGYFCITDVFAIQRIVLRRSVVL